MNEEEESEVGLSVRTTQRGLRRRNSIDFSRAIESVYNPGQVAASFEKRSGAERLYCE